MVQQSTRYFEKGDQVGDPILSNRASPQGGPVPEHHSVTIAEMMIATFIIAACTSSLANVSQNTNSLTAVIPTLCLFAVGLVVSAVLYQSDVVSQSRAVVYNQFIWGMLLPVMCIMTDPMIIGSSLLPIRSGVYCFLVWQIANMIASWFLCRAPNASAWFSGVFAVGAYGGFAIGVCMLPITLIGLLAVIGVLGLTPFITGVIYFRAGQLHKSQATQNENYRLFAVFGIVVSILLPLVIALCAAVYFQNEWKVS